MKYTIENLEGKVKVNFEIDKAEWEDAIKIAYNKTKSKYSVQGFRAGHVPQSVIEGMYGKGVFIEDAFNESFSKWYIDMLTKETQIYPVDRPEVDVSDITDDGIKFNTIITVKPDVVLGQYKGLKVVKQVAEVADADIDAELKKAQERTSRIIDVTDRAVADGDQVNLNYSGSVDGVKFDGGTADNQTLTIGSKTFIPGFEEQMIGMNIGDVKDIEVKFPDEYQAKDLQGKVAIFNVKVNEIKVKELPTIDDEFAKDVSEFSTLDEYKTDIKAKLLVDAIKKVDIANDNKLLEAICDNCKVEIPQAMIETQIDSYVDEFKYSLSYQGLKLEDYLKYTNTTLETMRGFYTDRAKKGVKTRLVMEAIIKVEELKVDDKAVEDKIVEIAEQSKQPVDEFRKALKDEELNYIKNEVLSIQVLDMLKKENTFTTK